MKKNYGNKVPHERNRQMVEMRKQGLTCKKIADKFGISRERVRQIMNKSGVYEFEVDRNFKQDGLLTLEQIGEITGYKPTLTLQRKMPKPITKRLVPTKKGKHGYQHLYDSQEVISACKLLFDQLVAQLKVKIMSKRFGQRPYTYAYHKKLVHKQLEFLLSKPFSSNHWHGQLHLNKSSNWIAHQLLEGN